MRRFFSSAWHFVRDHSGFLAATFGLIATYLASYVALIPPDKRLVPLWLFIFAILCALAFLASLIQQRATNTQTKAAEAMELKQTEMLEKIAKAVGATQAEAAAVAADTQRQIIALQVKVSEDSSPVVVIRYSVDGDKNPTALPSVQNIGRSAATNVKIEDITVTGAHGPGTFEEVDVLQPGETREVQFDAPEEGLMFRGYFINYLENELRNRPPINWGRIKTEEDAHDLFAPLKMPLSVVYADPGTGRRYRSEHELELTFGKHANVIFRRQSEIAA